MNNTDKLLRAFIEASGYEIEEVKAKETSSIMCGGNTYSNIDYKVTKKKQDPLFEDWSPKFQINEGEVVTYVDGYDYKMIDGLMVKVTTKGE